MSCLVCSDLSKTFIRIVSNFIGKNSSGTIKFRAFPFELHNIQFHNAVFFGNNIVYTVHTIADKMADQRKMSIYSTEYSSD